MMAIPFSDDPEIELWADAPDPTRILCVHQFADWLVQFVMTDATPGRYTVVVMTRDPATFPPAFVPEVIQAQQRRVVIAARSAIASRGDTVIWERVASPDDLAQIARDRAPGGCYASE